MGTQCRVLKQTSTTWKVWQTEKISMTEKLDKQKSCAYVDMVCVFVYEQCARERVCVWEKKTRVWERERERERKRERRARERESNSKRGREREGKKLKEKDRKRRTERGESKRDAERFVQWEWVGVPWVCLLFWLFGWVHHKRIRTPSKCGVFFLIHHMRIGTLSNCCLLSCWQWMKISTCLYILWKIAQINTHDCFCEKCEILHSHSLMMKWIRSVTCNEK